MMESRVNGGSMHIYGCSYIIVPCVFGRVFGRGNYKVISYIFIQLKKSFGMILSR